MADFIITTPEQLEILIDKSVRKALSERDTPSTEVINELLNVTEAAKLIGVAKPTLYFYTSKRLIPFIKRGGKKILFRRADLQSWLQEGKKASISEINKELDKDAR
jgi:excisionase family DNA binding protein